MVKRQHRKNEKLGSNGRLRYRDKNVGRGALFISRLDPSADVGGAGANGASSAHEDTIQVSNKLISCKKGQSSNPLDAFQSYPFPPHFLCRHPQRRSSTNMIESLLSFSYEDELRELVISTQDRCVAYKIKSPDTICRAWRLDASQNCWNEIPPTKKDKDYIHRKLKDLDSQYSKKKKSAQTKKKTQATKNPKLKKSVTKPKQQ